MPPRALESATRDAVLTGSAAEPVPVATVEQDVDEDATTAAAVEAGACVAAGASSTKIVLVVKVQTDEEACSLLTMAAALVTTAAAALVTAAAAWVALLVKVVETVVSERMLPVTVAYDSLVPVHFRAEKKTYGRWYCHSCRDRSSSGAGRLAGSSRSTRLFLC